MASGIVEDLMKAPSAFVEDDRLLLDAFFAKVKEIVPRSIEGKNDPSSMEPREVKGLLRTVLEETEQIMPNLSNREDWVKLTLRAEVARLFYSELNIKF